MTKGSCMKKCIGTVLCAAAWSLTAAPAIADPPTQIGTPGEENCVGQTSAFYAQLLQDSEEVNPGLGNVGRVTGLSVAETQERFRAYCAGVTG